MDVLVAQGQHELSILISPVRSRNRHDPADRISFFFVDIRRSIEAPALTYPRPMVSHMDLYYVLQRLVRCILAVFVALDVTPQWTQMADFSDMPIGITNFYMVFCSLIYRHSTQTNRHLGALWGLAHHPNQKTGGAWGFSWFY